MVSNIALIEKIYESFNARDFEAVMSNFADDIAWIVADNSPLADQNPYHGIPATRSGVFERIDAGFEKLIVDADEIFNGDGGRVVVTGYYYGKFRGAAEEFKTQVAHIWTARDGQIVKFQQYVDTLKVARDSGVI